MPMTDRRETLDVAGLTVSRAGREVLRAVRFTLAPGSLCGLIGANGSGKTTLLRAILGLVPAAPGAIRFAGQSRAPRGFIGYVPQAIGFESDLPLRARDVVALGLDGAAFGLPLPSRARRARVSAMLAAVGAEAFADQRIGALSGGQQQRILIAHAMIRRPRLLLLDEPLANLDVRAVAEVVALLRRLAAEAGVSILVSAHDMNPLLGAMDQVVYLAQGRAAAGPTEAVIRSAVLSGLYGHPVEVLRVHGRVLIVPAAEIAQPPLPPGAGTARADTGPDADREARTGAAPLLGLR
ncbi:ABC transporter ATP-binding protein [Acidisoma sp. C75]